MTNEREQVLVKLEPLRVTYFKKSGKYYTSAECEVTTSLLFNTTVDMYKEREVLLNKLKLGQPMPGLEGAWQNGFIVIEHEQAGFPMLIDLQNL